MKTEPILKIIYFELETTVVTLKLLQIELISLWYDIKKKMEVIFENIQL